MMTTIPININMFGARATIFKSEKFKHLHKQPHFEKIWTEFQQDVISWAQVDYKHDTTVIELKTLDYLVDRWFNQTNQLNLLNTVLKKYFNNVQHF